MLRVLVFVSLSAPLLASPDFVQCYDFGCKSSHEIRYSESQWREISALFDSISDSASEKQAIRSVIAKMESFSGEISGTHLDKAGNYPGYDIPGQMDCIDESTNTTQYLAALQALNLLKWHEVADKQRRIVWFVSHWTAVIVEIDNGRRFAVDSWYRDNGQLPYIQPLGDWQSKSDFANDYNPELATR